MEGAHQHGFGGDADRQHGEVPPDPSGHLAIIVALHYWYDTERGLAWAVELCNGRITRCAGPILVSECHAEILPHMRYVAGADVEWIEARKDLFRRLRAPTAGDSGSE
jgi:hypothetical protein